MSEKLNWKTWLAAYGANRLAKTLDIDKKTTYNWLKTKGLPKDSLKRQIIELSNGVLDYNSFFCE